MKRSYEIRQDPFTGNYHVVRKSWLFTKTVGVFHHNEKGMKLATEYCEHLNTWFRFGWWSNVTWL